MKKLVCSFALMILGYGGFCQTQNYQTYTLFMYSFTKFVQWPPEDAQGDFEIAVLGDSPIYNELKSMADKKKAGVRSIKVTKIASMAEYKKSHILYIPSDWSSKFQDVANKVGDESVLLVTDQANGGNKGCVNFVNNKEGRLAFELNQAMMTKHKLRASAALSRLAIIN
ncbi:MAG TPA: hypothetical protein DGG95_02480 [Cytophagales bacterium]|nr:hypothetical protein [Cytophagales bacterium]